MDKSLEYMTFPCRSRAGPMTIASGIIAFKLQNMQPKTVFCRMRDKKRLEIRGMANDSFSFAQASMQCIERRHNFIDERKMSFSETDFIACLQELVDKSGLDEPEKKVVGAHLEAALARALTTIETFKESGSLLKPLVRTLTDEEISEIIEVGKQHPWSEREKIHVRWSPVEWVKHYYGKWIPGLLTGHILKADKPLYVTLMKHISRFGLPEDLDIPAERENAMRSLPDENDRLIRSLRRQLHAMRKLVASRNKAIPG